MVDFNSETTVATPAVQVNGIVILEARKYYIDAYGAYYKQLYGGVDTSSHIVRSRLNELFLIVRAAIRRHITNKQFENLLILINSNDLEDTDNAFDIIDTWLDNIGLTQIDTKKKLGGNIADRNKAQGWEG
jgi:hypothetical protein